MVILGGGLAALYGYQKRRLTRNHLVAAQRFASDEDWLQAAFNYRAFLIERPGDTSALRAYVDVLSALLDSGAPEAGEWVGTAVRALRELVRRVPDDLESLEALADLQIRYRQFDEALYTLDRWTDAAPSALEPVLRRADVLRVLERSDEALTALEEAVVSYPGSDALYIRLIRLRLGDATRVDKAGEWVQKALVACPESWAVQLAASAYAEATGEMRRAEQHLQEAVRLAPEDATILLEAAHYHLRQREPAVARRYLDDATRVLGQDDTMPLLLAEAAWAKMQPSIEVRRRVADRLYIAAGDRSVRLLVAAADLYLQAKAMEQIDACIAKLEILAVARPMVAAIKGAKAIASQRPHAAVRMLEEAARSQPTNGEVAYLLGLARERAGMPAAARVAFQKATELRPQAILPILARARAAIQARRYEEANNHLLSIIRVDPRQSDAIRMKLALELQRVASTQPVDRDALAAVQDEITSALAVSPKDPELIRLAGYAYEVAGERAKAAALFKEKMTEPALAESMAVGLSGILVADNRLEDAIRLLRETMEKESGSSVIAERLLVILVQHDRVAEAEQLVRDTDDPSGQLFRMLGIHTARADHAEIAIDAFEEAAALRPWDIEIRQRLLRLKPIVADAAKTEQLIEQIKAIEGADGLVWQVEWARILLQRPEPDGISQSIEMLGKCIEARPAWVLPRLMLANVHDRHRGDTTAALEQYDEVVRLAPELLTRDVGQQYAILLKRTGRYKDADAVVDRLAKAQPGSPFVLRQLTEQNAREQDWDAAADLAQELGGRDPGDPAWMALTAELQRRAGRVQEAEQTARRAMELAPDAVEPLQSLAAMLVGAGRGQEAEQAVRTFLSARATDVDGHLLLGSVLSALGRAAEADSVHEHAAVLGADRSIALRQVSRYFGQRRDPARQLKYLRLAIQVAGEDPDDSASVARVLLASPQPADRAQGRAIVDRRLAKDPADPEALVLSAALRGSSSPAEQTQAIEQLTQMLQAQLPAHIESEAYRLLSGLHAVRGERDEALRVATRGLGRNPEDHALRLQRGRIAVFDGRWSTAMADLESVFKTAQNDGVVVGWLARAYEGGGGATPNANLQRQYLQRAEALLTQRNEQDLANSTWFVERIQFLERQQRYAEIKALTDQRRTSHPQDQIAQLTAASLVLMGDEKVELNQWAFGVLDGLTADGYRVADVLAIKAVHFQRRGEVDEAESLLNQGQEDDANNGQVINARAWIYCEDRDQPERAASILEPYLQDHSNDLAALDTYGVILYRRNQIDESVRVFRQCLAGAPTGGALAIASEFHLGRSLIALEQRTAGIRHIRTALASRIHTKVLTRREINEAAELLGQR